MLAGLYQCNAFETIVVTNAVKKLTQATYEDSDGNSAMRAVITVEDAPIRYRYDGGDPTAALGHRLNPMDALVLTGGTNIRNFRVIRIGATNGEINISYER